MNKDINIVLNSIAASAADLAVAGGQVTISDYSFPWKKLFSADKKVFVASAGAAITLTPASPSAGVEYGATLVQYVDNVLHTPRIVYTAVAGDTATTVCNNLRTLANAFILAGSLDGALSGTSTFVFTSTSASPVISAIGLVGLTASPSASVGTAGVNSGADLLAQGVIDSFSGELPVSGSEYTLYKLGLKAPKGHGGFNGQTSDQEVSLNIYLDENEADYSDLAQDLDDLFAGVNATSTNWVFADALAV